MFKNKAIEAMDYELERIKRKIDILESRLLRVENKPVFKLGEKVIADDSECRVININQKLFFEDGEMGITNEYMILRGEEVFFRNEKEVFKI